MKLAWKEIQHQIKKYLLVELLLVLMIFMVIFLSGLANGLARAVSASIEKMDANYFLLAEGSESMLSLSSIGNDDFKNLSDETKAGLNLQRGNITMADSEDKLDLTYMAINPEGILNPDNTLTTKENTIVLDKSFQSEGIKVGDIVKDSKTEKELEVTGFVSDALYGHVAVGYISTKTYQDMMGADDNTWAYNAIAIQSDSKPTTSPQHFEWVSKEELVEHIPGYSAEQTTIRMILWVLVVVSAAILGVFF
jgi:putative ABC transport system permease protein